MTTNDNLERGREAYRQNAWPDAFELLTAADRVFPLDASDLDLLAVAAHMSGKEEEALGLQERAHHAYLDSDNVERASRVAFWLGMDLMQKGEFARGGGWIARAKRLIEDPWRDCVEQGWVLLPSGVQAFAQGDNETALDLFSQAVKIGERFGDPSLKALARHGQGRALIKKGDVAKGLNLLDEAMVEVMSKGVYPLAVGIVYCSVIDACLEIFDLRRAQEWTKVLVNWTESQPDLVPFRGQCLVFRAEFSQLSGAWETALEQSATAAKRLVQPPPHPAAGTAIYQQAEVHRLRGDFVEAEHLYEQAREAGHSPQPGLALLRLAQGRVDPAHAAIRRELDETRDKFARVKMIPAYVEIMLAVGNVESARAASDEISKTAEELNAPYVSAVAAQASGAVLLDENDPLSALTQLRIAHEIWISLEAPYEAGRTSVLIGLACKQLGDHDTAEFEFKAARSVFEQLGAGPALSKLEELTSPKPAAGGMTGREVEVLSLLATGKTNREIAAELVISEKTVARHVANIFVKIGVSSRAAATAYAFKQDLV